MAISSPKVQQKGVHFISICASWNSNSTAFVPRYERRKIGQHPLRVVFFLLQRGTKILIQWYPHSVFRPSPPLISNFSCVISLHSHNHFGWIFYVKFLFYQGKDVSNLKRNYSWLKKKKQESWCAFKVSIWKMKKKIWFVEINATQVN